ncbi:MAG: hypothetical protein AAFX03_11680 [Pseudomonadota bacterium]
MDGVSWIFWPIIGVLMMMAFCGPNSKRHRRRRRSPETGEPAYGPRKSEEVERLKAELEASQAQIAALKSRLEAVETIVTDEENELRREFRKLQTT